MTEKKMNNKKNAQEVWIDFLSWVSSHSGDWVYRGVSNQKEHLLIPSIGRKPYSLGIEINLFEEFKLKANLHTNAKNDYEWLAIAQHHGLPTRLLDWTFNPLVAVFFAVTDRVNSNNTGRIYAFDPSVNDYVNINEDLHPFQVNRVKFLYPPVSTNRIELQKGIFSIHPVPNKPAIILQDPKIERTTLSAMDFAYTLHKDNIHFCYNIPPFIRSYDTNHEYYLNYQENYLNNYCNKKLVFDIPDYCKEIFEQNIRNLGIDENIFGGIDAIANHLRYKFTNHLLSYHTLPETSCFYPEWENILASSFYEKTDTHSLLLEGVKCNYIIEKNAKFRIENSDFKLESFGRSHAKISGASKITIRPNCLKQKSLFFNNHSKSEQFLNQISCFFQDVFYEYSLNESMNDIGNIKFDASVKWVDPRFRKALKLNGSIQITNVTFDIDDTLDLKLKKINAEYAKKIDKFEHLYKKIKKKYLEIIIHKDCQPEEYKNMVSTIFANRNKRKKEKQSTDK